MSAEIPSENDLLQFVGNVKYGDFSNSAVNENFSYDFNEKNLGGALHISSVLPALSDAIDAPVKTAIHNNPHALREILGFPKSNSAIVVLIDGLGYWNILMRKGHAPYLRSLLKESINQRPISTCVPSTTVAAMTTFGTGTCPGLTCMTGYTQKNSQTGKLAQLIQFNDAPDPLVLQQEPTIFESLVSNGVRADSVGLPKFENTPLTKAAFRGANYITAGTPRARILKAANNSKTPGLTYMYLRDADKTGHNYGWDSQQWVSVFEQIDEQLRLLRANCAPGTLIVITADHGMIKSDPNKRIDIAKHDELIKGVSMVGGEPRSVMLYANSDANPEDIIYRWREYFGTNAIVRSKKQAIDDGIFGLVNNRAEDVIGDVIVQACGAYTIVDSRIQSDKAMSLPSVHGSMTHMEMDIPCLIDLV